MCVPKMMKYVQLSVKGATTRNDVNDHDMLVSIGHVMSANQGVCRGSNRELIKGVQVMSYVMFQLPEQVKVEF